MQVKVKIRPQEALPFPGICVHCAQPAAREMEVRRRIGRVTRLIAVPLCSDCQQKLDQQSPQEERLQSLGRIITGVALLVTLALTLLLPPAELTFALRILVALLAGLVVAEVLTWWFRRVVQNAASPEKKAIRQSAAITHFSWRATTFDFVNETFAARFRQLNEPFLMEL
ncbi:MAG: hypothetical protein ACE5EY_12140 [Anaerolineae bacterium]